MKTSEERKAERVQTLIEGMVADLLASIRESDEPIRERLRQSKSPVVRYLAARAQG